MKQSERIKQMFGGDVRLEDLTPAEAGQLDADILGQNFRPRDRHVAEVTE